MQMFCYSRERSYRSKKSTYNGLIPIRKKRLAVEKKVLLVDDEPDMPVELRAFLQPIQTVNGIGYRFGERS